MALIPVTHNLDCKFNVILTERLCWVCNSESVHSQSYRPIKVNVVPNDHLAGDPLELCQVPLGVPGAHFGNQWCKVYQSYHSIIKSSVNLYLVLNKLNQSHHHKAVNMTPLRLHSTSLTHTHRNALFASWANQLVGWTNFPGFLAKHHGGELCRGSVYVRGSGGGRVQLLRSPQTAPASPGKDTM